MKLSSPATRYCPECDNFGLEVTENVNIYKCKACDSIWQRLRPLNDGFGNMINMPKNLKKLFPSLDAAGKKEIKNLFEKRVKEFDSAWEEFFKDKSEPKTDEEDIKQQEEFSHWYNYIRKQSDINLTPKEMFDSGMENRMFELKIDEEDEYDE